MLNDLRDRAVIVTGAASGMGEAAARLLAGEGARLALLDVDAERLAALALELGGTALALPVDVSSREQVASAVARVEAQLGRIDGLLHFAGILDQHQLEDVDDAVWQRVTDVNLKGTFLMVQAVAPVMRRQRFGRIVLTSSDSARCGSLVSGPAYAATKGGVIALTRTLAKYLGPSGITVNGICPGLAMTPMSRSFDPAVVEETVRRTPLGRLAEARDIAGVAVLLLSDLAGFVTGEVVEVNGGLFFD